MFQRRIAFEWTRKELISFLSSTVPTIDVSLLTLPEAEELLQQPRVISMSPDGKWYIQCQPMSAAGCNVRFITRTMVFFSFLYSYLGNLPVATSYFLSVATSYFQSFPTPKWFCSRTLIFHTSINFNARKDFNSDHCEQWEIKLDRNTNINIEYANRYVFPQLVDLQSFSIVL